MAEDQNKNGSQKGGLTKDKDVLDPTKSGDKKSKGIGESAQDLRKKVDGAKKAGGVAKTVITFLTSNPVGWVILGIIVLIIVVVGVYYFFTTIPGLAMAKLKAILQGGIDLVQSWFTTEADAYINEEDVVELANYLEELEYDLVGYGFIVPTSSTTSEYPTYDELIAAGYSYGITEYDSDGDGTEESAYRYYMDDESKIYDGVNYYITNDDGSIVSDTSYYYNSIGVLIDNTTGSVVADDTYTDKYALVRSTEELATSGQGVITDMGEADTTLLRTYLLSDYRIYAIRNNDDNLMNKVYSRIKKTFGGYSSAWSKGLLKFYYATDGLAEKEWSEDLLATLTGGSIDFGDAIKISDDGKTLSLKKGNFNNAMEFTIDGWADRYGMSLEFLLSLHLATGSPELVYAMLQSFDIEVQVYLNDSGDAEVTGGYVDLVDADATFEEDFISWDTVVDVVTQAHEDGIINDFQYSTIAGDDDIVGWDSLSLTKKFCQYLLKNLNLTSPDNCLGAAQWETIVKATLDDEWIDSNDLLSYSITDEDLNDAIDEYTNYSYLDDDGGDHDFTIGHLTNSIGTDDTSYLEETYTYFPNTAANNGYSEDTAEIAEIDTEEFETKVYSDGDASAGTWSEYTMYTTTRVKQVRTWTSTVDGEEVEFEWVTYKYLVYKTGIYKTYSYQDSVTTTLDEPEWVDTIMVEWIARDKTDAELIEAGILDENGNITEDVDLCSSQDWASYKKCCKIAKNT